MIFRWLICTVGLGAVIATTVLVHAQDVVPAHGATYAGTLTTCQAPTFSLGQPFSIRTAEYGSKIVDITVNDITLASQLVPSVDVPVDIPVATDGSFTADFSPFGASFITSHVDGRFVGTSVSGAYRLTINGESCAGTLQAQLVPRVRHESTFSGQIALANGCGGGTFSIIRSPDLLSITKISVDGVVAGGQTFSGSATFPEGTVPIDPSSGAFGWVYFADNQPGQEIALSGSFDGAGSVRGALTASPSSCGQIAFPASTTRGGLLPNTGTGPNAASSALRLLEAIAAALGLALLATGLAIRRSAA